MRALIKLGGALLDDAAARKRLAVEIATVHADGLELVLVHGGGKQMTRFLAGQGIESQFVNGLRVTSSEVLDAVVKVIAGSVNKQLVAELTAAGVRAAGLSGLDGLITEAEQLDPSLGFVGKPVRANPELLQLLTANGYLPVIACVAGDRSGQIFNVNADQMASACAAAFEADLLLFLTDVPGVRGADGQTRSDLTVAECEELVRSGVASGGMETKLKAATQALACGLKAVIIAPGAMPDVIGRTLAGEKIGTRLVSKEIGRG